MTNPARSGSTTTTNGHSKDLAQDDHIPLRQHPGLYINLSTPKGRGVFTSTPIPAGTVIDTCAVLILSPTENTSHIEHTELYHYTYNWPVPGKPPTQAVIFGLGSMFNHSLRDQNVGWKRDLEREVVVYRALRDIAVGEQLCISYGDRLTFVDADAVADEIADGVDEDEHLGRIQLET